MYNAINAVAVKSLQMRFDSSTDARFSKFAFFVEIKLLRFTNLFTKSIHIVVTSCKRTWSKNQKVILPYLTKYFCSKYISVLINMYSSLCTT